MNWKHLLLGRVQFDAAEEYLAFKYAFALILMWAGLPLLALFIAGDLTGANSIGLHRWTVRAYFLLSCLLIALLRGRKQWFAPAVWVFAVASLGVHLSGFIFVPQDELRLVWFYSLIAGVYILLGRRAGALFTVASVALVLACNPHQPAPISSRGLGTFITSLVSLSVIFHVFTQQTTSFFLGMLRSNERLRQLSEQDPLTGLLNARAFAQACDRLVRLAERHGTGYAVLFVDLDHFKRVNDQYGHDAGDCVLRTVAEVMRQRLRQSDVLGRVGGEEFVIFLPDTDATGAMRLAEDLRRDIEASCPRIGQAQPLCVTASIGVAPGRAGGNLESLQKQADQAMYLAKAAGRNRVTLFE